MQRLLSLYRSHAQPFIRRVGWLTLAQVVASLASFVGAVVLGYFLTPEVYGTYKYVISLSLLFSSLSLTGASIALIRSVAQGKSGTVHLALSSSFRWSLVSSGITLLVALYYFVQGNETLALALVIVAVLDPIIRSFGLYTSYLNGRKDFKRISLYGMLPDLALVLGLSLAAFFTDSVIAFVAVYFAINAVLHYLLFTKTLKQFPPNDDTDESFMKSNKHLSVMNIFQTGAQHLDKVLVFGWIGAAPLAVYFFAISVPEQLRAFFKIANALVIPEFADARVAMTRARVLPTLWKATGVIAVLVLFYILIAPFMFALFFPQYLSSVPYSQVFAVSLIGMSAFAILVSILQAKDELRKLHYINFLSACIQIGLIFIFLVVFKDLWGIVWARILATLLLPLMCWYIGFTPLLDKLPRLPFFDKTSD